MRFLKWLLKGYNASSFTGDQNFQNYEKWLYTQYMKYGNAEAMMTQNSLTWKLLKQSATRSYGGKNETCPILVGGTQAHSKNFKIAQALSKKKAGDVTVDTWVGNRDRDYAVDNIEHEEWTAALNKMSTFKNKRKLQLDSAIRALGVRKEAEIWGLGQNRRFKIKAMNAVNKTITVDSPEQVLSLEKNGMIEFRSPAGVAREAGRHFS